MARRKLTASALRSSPTGTRPGPKPRGGGEVKRLTIRLSADEHERTQALAEKRGVTASDIARAGLLREIGD